MQDFVGQHCEACKVDSPVVTEDQLKSFINEHPQWEVANVDNVPRLHRTYSFKNFMQALDFTNMIGEVAEEEGHHPALLTEWGKVQVAWWTHAIKGLHVNDCIMAAKSEALYESISE